MINAEKITNPIPMFSGPSFPIVLLPVLCDIATGMKVHTMCRAVGLSDPKFRLLVDLRYSLTLFQWFPCASMASRATPGRSVGRLLLVCLRRNDWPKHTRRCRRLDFVGIVTIDCILHLPKMPPNQQYYQFTLIRQPSQWRTKYKKWQHALRITTKRRRELFV